MTAYSLEIDILREAGNWPSVEDVVQRAVGAAFEHTKIPGACEISIVLADNAFIQNLNRDYRGKDKPTNVLSFAQGDENFTGSLGDIVLAYETIERESIAQQKTFSDHLTHLLVHGFLHLLGHDHEEDSAAETMESVEIEILKTLGIKNPYEN